MTDIASRLDTVLPTLAAKADFAEVRADIHKMDASIKIWMICTTVGILLGCVGLFFLFRNLISQDPGPVASAPQVIVITIPIPAAPESRK